MAALPPLFILGCERSGTTLLQLTLSAHPAICMCPEGSPLLALRGLPDGRDLAGREAELLARLAREPKIAGRWQVSEEEIRAQWALRRPLTRAAAVEGVHVAQQARHKPGALMWGDKNPIHVLHAGLVRRTFPGARRLHLARDPRAVWASVRLRMATLGNQWTGFCQGMVSTAILWREATLAARADAAIPAALHLRYEDLVAEPGREVRRVCDWLGVEFDAGMLEGGQRPVRQTFGGDRGPRSPLMSKPITAARREAWREELAPGEVAALELLLGGLMREEGHALVGGDRAAGCATIARELARAGHRQRLHVAATKAMLRAAGRG